MVIDTPVRSTFSDDAERSPHASRVGRSRWLNPQVIIGLVLVLGATALGARLFAAADDTVPVLVAAADLRPGQPLTDASVETRRMQLDDALDRYHTGDVGSGYVAIRPVDQGELIPTSAVSAAGEDQTGDVRYLSLSLPSDEVPRSIAAGSSVDVWVTPNQRASNRSAEVIARAVTVAAADTASGSLGIEGSRTSITVAVRPDQVTATAEDDDAEGEGDDADSEGDDADSEDPANDEPDSDRESTEFDELVATLVGAARDDRVYLVLRPEQVDPS